MSSNKRTAKFDDVKVEESKEPAPKRINTEFSLKDIEQSAFPVVVYKDELLENLRFSALHIKESVFRQEIAQWLRGKYADVNIHALRQKCEHHSALDVILEECESLEGVKYVRLVHMISTLSLVTKVSSISDAVKDMDSDVCWNFDGTKPLLSRSLEELTVKEVLEVMYNHHAELIEALPGTATYDLCSDLCSSNDDFGWWCSFTIKPLDRVYYDKKTKHPECFDEHHEVL
jgi:hypothetical protein